MVNCGDWEAPPANQHLLKLPLQPPGFPGTKEMCCIENWEQGGQDRDDSRERKVRESCCSATVPTGGLLPSHSACVPSFEAIEI